MERDWRLLCATRTTHDLPTHSIAPITFFFFFFFPGMINFTQQIASECLFSRNLVSKSYFLKVRQAFMDLSSTEYQRDKRLTSAHFKFIAIFYGINSTTEILGVVSCSGSIPRKTQWLQRQWWIVFCGVNGTELGCMCPNSCVFCKNPSLLPTPKYYSNDQA